MSELPERNTANTITSALPKAAHSQNPIDGRWRCSSAPTTAVANGSTPTITLACMASTWRMAIDVNSGNPNTMPPAVIANGNQSRRAGNGARVISSKAADRPPASTARPMAINRPDICGASGVPTARRVMGSVTEKMTMPSNPSQRPLLISSLLVLAFINKTSTRR